MVTRLAGKTESERIVSINRPLIQVDPNKISSYEQALLRNSNYVTGIIDEWIDTFRHTNPHKQDIDMSDSIKFVLSAGQTRSIILNVPSGYVFLLKKFIVSDIVNCSYQFKINTNIYLTGAEFLSENGMGIAINELTSVSMTITNDPSVSNEFSSQVIGVYRSKSLWSWPTVTSKSQLYKRLG